MSVDPSNDPRTVAIEQLEALGLSSYAARTFVALVGIGDGTARQISEASEVPRTRVYDAVDELRDYGLVDVRDGSPKEFWVVSVETAKRNFQREMETRLDSLDEALRKIRPTERHESRQGVWTTDGYEAVTERVLGFFATADEEIVYTTTEHLLTDAVLDGLAEAANRGVSIRIANASSGVRDRIRESVPGAEFLDGEWPHAVGSAARMLLVDGDTTLISVRSDGGNPGHHDPPSETAVWGSGTSNNLVVVLKEIVDGGTIEDGDSP